MNSKSSTACPICEKRKPRRACPAKSANICSLCCGQEREVSISCPLDCAYLRESRQREHVSRLEPKGFPFKEVEVDRQFLEGHGDLLNDLAKNTLESAMMVHGATDTDTQQALEALIEGYKTLENGIHYERRPDSAYGRAVFDQLREWIHSVQRRETEQTGFKRTRDKDIMVLLVFLYRMALDRDNGKPKGRAFLDFLQRHFQLESESQSALIIPGR